MNRPCDNGNCFVIDYICKTCGKADSGNEFFRARARIRKVTKKVTRRRRFTKSQKAKIFERDGWVCLACNVDLKTLPDDQRCVDHIRPLILGGTNDPANLQSLCYSCDKVKGVQIIDYNEIRNRTRNQTKD
jgi:5-methylcytosine-specific restriction protein A